MCIFCQLLLDSYEIVAGIEEIRNGNLRQDDIILNRLMNMDNYKEALDLLLNNEVTETLVCEIGFNRKSRKYDKPYFALYEKLYDFYVNGNEDAFVQIYSATRDIKIGKWWRNYLFNTTSKVAISRNPLGCKNSTVFDDVNSVDNFKIAFFKTMHLFKAKATLSDYLDLNRRYVKTTDVVLFEDDTVKLDIVPKHFFNTVIDELYSKAFTENTELIYDCAIEDIDPCLALNEQVVINGVNAELGTTVTTIAEAQNILEDIRYTRLQHLIDTKFTNDNILTLLEYFEARNDDEIRGMVTDNADIPTIFEYVLAILWYKISERQGKVLDYMKLSLDADLLPKTHAAGGEADIVYEYAASEYYPEHTMLLEATLADGTNQRRMEMEPVSRHLGQHLLHTHNNYAYCVFATTFLHINVLADFRGRKNMYYYDSVDHSQFVNEMKIIPLQTSELKALISGGKTYKELYAILEEAYNSELPPHEWYEICIKNSLN